MSKPKLTLFLGVDPEKPLPNASVPIRWCLAPGTAQELIDLGTMKPMLLLVVVDAKGREERALIRLDDIEYYVPFQTAGANTVLAAIVWNSDNNDIGQLRSLLLGRESSKWSTTLVTEYDRGVYKLSLNRLSWPFSYLGDGVAEPLELDVPEEAFAPEPPAWLKGWVNLFWQRDPCQDQCHFRKRAIFAFTIQPLLMLIGCTIQEIMMALITPVVLLVATVLLTNPFGAIRWELFLKPWRYVKLGDIITDEELPTLWDKVLPVIKKLWGRKGNGDQQNSWRQSLEWIKTKRQLAKQQRERLTAQRQLEQFQELGDLLCCETTRTADPLALVRTRRRRIYLQFMRLKGRVCQPFQH